MSVYFVIDETFMFIFFKIYLLLILKIKLKNKALLFNIAENDKKKMKFKKS